MNIIERGKQPAAAAAAESEEVSSGKTLKKKKVSSGRSFSTSQALITRESGSGGGNGGIGNGEASLDSLVLSLAPPFFVIDGGMNNVPPPPQPAPAAPARIARYSVLRDPNIPPPYPWATNRRATVHSLDYLLDKKIFTITGEVSCKKCRNSYTMEFDLLSKFLEVKDYIICFREKMKDRASTRWTNPEYPTCKACRHPGSLRPTFGKKRNINWLFLFISQLMGGCNIAHLKYFCKHTLNHRTGAKDRLLFLAYLGVGKQLQDIEAFTYRPY